MSSLVGLVMAEVSKPLTWVGVFSLYLPGSTAGFTSSRACSKVVTPPPSLKVLSDQSKKKSSDLLLIFSFRFVSPVRGVLFASTARTSTGSLSLVWMRTFDTSLTHSASGFCSFLRPCQDPKNHTIHERCEQVVLQECIQDALEPEHMNKMPS